MTVMNHISAQASDAVLVKSALRALQWLQGTDADPLDLLGLRGQNAALGIEGESLAPESRSAALQLVQIYRSVYALVGANPQQGQAWMGSHNDGLGDTPANLIRTPEGRSQLLGYLGKFQDPV